jgi:mannosylglucosylglycerate synthase
MTGDSRAGTPRGGTTIVRDIAILHFAGPPVVGGVESVIGHHARLLAGARYRVRIVAGRGAAVDERVRFVSVPPVDSQHPAVLAAKAELDRGRIPANFEHLVAEIESELAAALEDVELVMAHNVCSLHKNLALTAALRSYCARPGAPRLIAWHHDLAWTSGRYLPELHDGWPWQLLREDWPEVRPQHVVVSELRRRELAGLLGLDMAAIAVVPSGLDAADFLKLEPRTVELVNGLQLLRADPLLLLPVRITTRKNIELALRTVAAMAAAYPATMLLVTGPPGPHNPANHAYFDSLRQLRTELNLNLGPDETGATVHFLTELVAEYLPDAVIADLFRLADALFMPSREEGFGIPLLEAGLAGLPVFCADIPPLREIAGTKANYFSPDVEPAVLARSMAAYLDEDAVFQLRRRVRHDYTWEAIFSDRIAPLLEAKK